MDTQWSPSFISRAKFCKGRRYLAQKELSEAVNDVTIPFIVIKKAVKLAIDRRWEHLWNAERLHDDRGRHLFNILPVPASNVNHQWSDSRRLSSLRCRLRHGHCELNEHLCKLKKVDNPGCPYLHCSETETVEHYLFDCAYYADARIDLLKCVPPGKAVSMAVICGTDPTLKPHERESCVHALEQFVESTARFV